MILAGDIGGTKTVLALYEYKEKTLSLYKEQLFRSNNYVHFLDLLQEFTSPHVQKVDAVCLGIAGHIINGVCHTTNLPWTINSKELQKKFNTQNVHLLNDLEASAYGMLHLQDDEFVELNPNTSFTQANRAVIAAGTGLGEAILFHDGLHFHPMASEGGHCDFAPLSPLQDELLIWLRKHYTDHVSVERILSGDGIYTLYTFLKEKGFAKECETMLCLQEGEDKNALVTQCALQTKDPLCVETVKLFVAIYGAETGNLALKSLSLGGLYIGGGIAPKILPFLTDGSFLHAFSDKGRFKKMLEGISIRISLNPNTALLGASHYALVSLLKDTSKTF